MRRDEFTEKQLIEEYKNCPNIAELAENLNVNRKSLWRWLRDLGVDTSRKQARHNTSGDWGSVAKWIRGYPHPLPRSIAQISELSGINKRAVRSYLDRRKELFRTKVEQYIEHYHKYHTQWPDGTPIKRSPRYVIEVDFWGQAANIYPELAAHFTLNSTPKKGYKNKSNKEVT